MTRSRLGTRLPAALILALGLLAATHSLRPLREAKKTMRSQAPPLFFPSAATVKLLAFGHQTTLADILYMWCIQYFGDTTREIQDRRGWTVRVFGTITDLDPRFRDAYWLGFVSLLDEVNSPDDAFRLADKALKNDPEFTWMAIEAAMTARRLQRTELMLAYLKHGSDSGDILARRFLTRLTSVDWAQQERAAWADLETEDDELTRTIAKSHVRDLTVLIDVETLSALARCFKRERGLAPASLEQLVAAGYLSSLGLDPEGKPYLYDQATLTVRSSTRYRHAPPSRARLGVDLSGLGRCRPPDPVPATAAAP